MPIKVYKVADIIDGEVLYSGTRRSGDLAAVLTNIQPPTDANPDSAWKIELIIGEGDAARRIKIDLGPILSHHIQVKPPHLYTITRQRMDLPHWFSFGIAFLFQNAQPIGLLIRRRLFSGLRKPFTTKKANYPAFVRLSPT